MKKIISIIFIVVLSSCSDFLTENVKTDITQENYFGPNTSEIAIEQFINGIYISDIWTIWDRRYPWFAEVPADGFNHSTSFDAEGQEYDQHFFNPEQYNIFRQWCYIWWPIGRANLFLSQYDFLEQNYGNQWARLKWFKGQALFFRAYYYYIGVVAWGEIPLVLDPPDGRNYPNSTLPELYNQIIADLKEIVDNNLCPPYLQLPAADKGRITMAAVKSLLAKVYLTRSYSTAAVAGDVDNAVLYAKDVVDNSGHALITTPDLKTNGDTLYTAYEKPFLPAYSNSVEGIYEYQFFQAGAGSRTAEDWVPRNYYGNYGNSRFHATPLLWNSFEPGDIRKKSYITGEVLSKRDPNIIINAGNRVYLTKFHDPEYTRGVGSMRNNFHYIRFADMLLIYAEALNKQNNGPNQAAFDAINRVRNRAGLPNLSGTYNYAQFLKAIQDERFIELAGESQRLWDLRRWGYETLKQRVELASPHARVEPHEVLWPIPAYEIQQNPLIKQNKGY
jgi:starch-binding outer membrane protein, SusD/RagB family